MHVPKMLMWGRSVMQAADVYAFGVLLWELAAGQRMFAGMPWAQVMAAITLRHMRPRLPPGRAMPSGLESIVRMCLSADASDRPCFAEVNGSPSWKVLARRSKTTAEDFC